MPPPRKKAKPHPRSLDALFPKPKVKRCARGHTQTPEWRAAHGCSTCAKIDEAARLVAEVKARMIDDPDEGKREREAWASVLPPLPDPYVLYSHDGRRQVFRAGGGRRRRRA